MNTREQVLPDLATHGVATPFLLDDGSVSQKYDTLGKGMHAGLPGRSLVLIDKDGVQRWYGEYPSMWTPPRTCSAGSGRIRADGDPQQPCRKRGDARSGPCGS